jgi:oligogalacturonide transporter
MITTLFIREENWQFVYLIAAFSGLGTAASVFVPWTILPEVTDVDEIISGKRREGIYGGFATFLRKVAGGSAIAILGLLLSKAGYLSQDQLTAQNLLGQSPQTINNLRLMFTIIPSIFIVIALFFSLRYNVNSRRHAVLMTEIERLKKGGSKDEVSPQTKQICEEVTGLKYEKLWQVEKLK